MTETQTAPAPDDTDVEDGEVSELAANETPLATTQAAHLAHVLTLTEDQRQGIWGQDIN